MCVLTGAQRTCSGLCRRIRAAWRSTPSASPSVVEVRVDEEQNVVAVLRDPQLVAEDGKNPSRAVDDERVPLGSPDDGPEHTVGARHGTVSVRDHRKLGVQGRGKRALCLVVVGADADDVRAREAKLVAVVPKRRVSCSHSGVKAFGKK